MQPYFSGEHHEGSFIYDLYAVSNHHGSLGGGHYTAYAKNKPTGQWFNFNDSHAGPVRGLSEIVSSSAYALFYEQRGAFN
jgi:ubiquitin C-terminal hydrolase